MVVSFVLERDLDAVSEDVREKFRALQIEAVPSTPEELRALQKHEIAERGPLIEALGLVQP